ncbi:cbb3-type cytochrome c oxidase subunit I [Hydrogenobacter thermophilus]|uniref:cbb3-type cytochrome c oxidase subunit I n=1 Tax=Hydrogenobacter thermophilus TaxID=940 RepID=UPI0030FC8E0B
MHLFYLSLSLLSLVLAGVFGLLIALTRAPAFSLLKSPSLFYHFLVGHVTFSITVWLMTVTLAYWHYKEGRKGRVAPPATLLGMLLLSLSCLLPYGEPYLNNYIPVIDSPIFYAGLFVFFLAFFFEALSRVKKLKEITSFENIPQLYAMSVALGLATLLSLIPSFFIANAEGGQKLYFERLFWIPGHLQQFLYASVMLAVWHELLKRGNGKEVSSPLLSTVNFLLLVFPSLLMAGFFTDIFSREFRLLTVMSFGLGTGVPVLIHTYYVLKNIRLSADVPSLALLSSVSVYYAGVVVAYAGMQSDLRVPAHYHGVVSAVSIAFMGLGYSILKERLGYICWERVAKLQPVVLSMGINLLVLGFYMAGRMGAPRKTYGFEYVMNTKVLIALNIAGLGSLMAVLGGLLFILYAGQSLLRIYKHAKAY